MKTEIPMDTKNRIETRARTIRRRDFKNVFFKRSEVMKKEIVGERVHSSIIFLNSERNGIECTSGY